jgi:hypothetical protein
VGHLADRDGCEWVRAQCHLITCGITVVMESFSVFFMEVVEIKA